MSRNPVFVDAGRQTFNVKLRRLPPPEPRGKSESPAAIGPDLTDQVWIHGGNPTDLYRTVTEGVPAKGMPTWGPVLGAKRITEVGGLRAEPPQGRRAHRSLMPRHPAAGKVKDAEHLAPQASPRLGHHYPRGWFAPVPLSGRLSRAASTRSRRVALALIAVYLLLPWIKVGGYPGGVPRRRQAGASTFSGSPWPPRTSGCSSSSSAASVSGSSSSRRSWGASGAAGPARRPCSSTTSTGGSSAGSRATR